MWSCLKTIFLYVLILLYRRHWHDDFTESLARTCRKRRNRKHVPGIREELDEVVALPDRCTDDLTFTGISKDGILAYFRSYRQGNGYVHTQVAIDIPGTGRFIFSDVQAGHGTTGLRLQMLEPMRRWKIYFRGPLTPVSSDTDVEPIHAHLSFYWECIADPFSYWSNTSPWQQAKHVAEYRFVDAVRTVTSWYDRTSYDQWGEMQGRIDVAGFVDKRVIFKSARCRTLRSDTPTDEQVVIEHIFTENGSLYATLGIVKDTYCRSERKFGYATRPIGESCSLDLPNLALEVREDGGLALHHPYQIRQRKQYFNIERERERVISLHMDHVGEINTVVFSDLTVNDQRAFGIRHYRKGKIQELSVEKGHLVPTIAKGVALPDTLVLPIQEEECILSSLVGGKGAQLALLRRLNHRVPRAFCITINAFNLHVESHSELKDSILSIEHAIQNRANDLASICKTAVEICESTTLKNTLERSLKDQLMNTFGDSFRKLRFAVRSSGVSEDGSEASSAGQMLTVLGTRNFDQIASAICKCWASSLAYQVVEYRRKNGQPVIEPMAVVVQEMVDADVAGVLFTNDPVTGNTSTMVVNAAPGLGEAVVSGQSTPDSIRVERRKSGQELRITEVTVGTRKTKIVMKDEGGVQEVENEPTVSEACLSNYQISEIAEVGLEIERALGSAQDIEWALSDGTLFLLQTRPITSLDLETEEELIHEFDSPVAMDASECITTCNVGEMLPTVATPLTRDLFFGAMGSAIRWMYKQRYGMIYSEYATKFSPTYANRGFLDMTAIIAPLVFSVSSKKNNIEIFLMGESVSDHTEETLRLYQEGRKPFLFDVMCFLRNRLFHHPSMIRRFNRWIKEVETFQVGQTSETSLELYDGIDEQLHVFFDTWWANTYKTAQSTLWIGVLMGILRKGSQELTAAQNADLSLLLANCKNVHSAGVPTAVQELARDIALSGIKEEFLALPDEKCHAFLRESEHTIRAKYKQFLQDHGHRCIREAEFSVKSWEMDPVDLMHTLKLLIKTESYNTPLQDELSPKEAVSLLQTPLSPFKKFLFEKVFIPKARFGVVEREQGKSITIKTQNAFKKAYWRLADMMVRESRIPDDDLLFYLTHREIGTLLETRSPVLVRKAKRRRSVLPKQEAIRYRKTNIGRPVPLPEVRRSTKSSTVLTGMAVGRGEATGRACVIRNVEDADSIEKGDILICPFTDVGWTPYFSMISGLVTEMGGLLSHGSVVAREVGIPCVVNVKDATGMLRTGDKVRIDGLNGTITKL